ncbi:TonB-dependent receptor domain-containing protein [Paremcibacter congregatus]|uniref:TonB-dependent receptor domain-containing protein n=1 Tax=Paremcibacter congregatus TaxID=2043170 RepID=UPI003A950769
MTNTPDYNSANAAGVAFLKSLLCSAAFVGAALFIATDARSEDADMGAYDDVALEEVVVTGKPVAYANNATDNVMLEQKAPSASVLSLIDNLPGIFIAEGGTFGSDDWSTTISIRGFNVGLQEQQIGMTIDGLPNGNSNYGGGSKANRYTDSENIARVDVSQGTSDISSPSHEALGGTINFVTNNPNDEAGATAAVSLGNNNAQRYFFRYDTGEILENTHAYISYSRTDNDAWIGNAGFANRDHIAAKFVTELEEWTLTGRFSWDNAHEDNFQRISLGQFEENPHWDRLTDTLTGIPYVDQAFRESWSTLRTNYFTYLRASYGGDKLTADITPYFHIQKGRGDWAPQYVALIADGSSTKPSGVRDLHTGAGTVYGGSLAGGYSFVDAAGTPLAPTDGCTARLTFPYGGGGAGDNPACYEAGANPASSYRHTHYNKQRLGLTANAEYEFAESNTLKAGLWWERADRDESRDWHKIIDPRTSHKFEEAAYWRQYDRNFVTSTFMLYAEDTIRLDDLTVRGGVRKYFVDIDRKDNFGIQNDFSKNSNSDILFSAGALYNVTEDLEVFAGFAQNFAAIKDGVVEGSAGTANGTSNAAALAAIEAIKPETADNFDVGFRYSNDWLRANLTGYYIKFNNRITSIATGDSVGGIDYGEEVESIYLNVGGVKSVGAEASISADVSDNWNIFSSVTVNDSEYTDSTGSIVKGNKVALASEFMMVGTLSYHNDKGVRAGVSAKHVGKRWGDLSNTDRLPSYTLVDLWAGYTLEMNGMTNIDLGLNVNNLADKRYLGGGTPGGYFIGTGRQVMATIKVGF